MGKEEQYSDGTEQQFQKVDELVEKEGAAFASQEFNQRHQLCVSHDAVCINVVI
jgi:hypothetical protein